MTKRDNACLPIVFVTGVGQTWTSLRGNDKTRWNLFARDPEVIFGDLSAAQKAQLMRTAGQIVRFLACGGCPVDRTELRIALSTLLRFCVADDKGELPLCTDVHIYGARSFAELSTVDFFTGEQTQKTERTLLDRLLRDVPCRTFMEQYGAENMYCFNYSPFTDLYAAAEALHETLRAIVAKRSEDKVLLVPMSMGAAVTLAYLDRYYTPDGPVKENFIDHVVSVVGAWDGSEGFADLLMGRVCEDWNTRFFDETLPKMNVNPLILRSIRRHPERLNTLLRQLLDALLDGVLMRSSAFLALVPHGRWDEMYPYLFSDERFAQNSRLLVVQKQTDRFLIAQENLRQRMQDLYTTCGIRFAFVGGTGLKPGEESRDFDFMKYLRCADRTDTDGVLQLSSSMPFDMENPAPYVQGFTVYDRQPHEIGDNAEAMRQIFRYIVPGWGAQP